MEAKKDQRDYGVVLGQALTRSCTRRRRRSSSKMQDEERTTLLGHDQTSQSKAKARPFKRPSWRQVFSPQSNLTLLAYGMMSMHGMAFDSLFPVFLHQPAQNLHDNPNVQLPFKFVSGFGVGKLRQFRPYPDTD